MPEDSKVKEGIKAFIKHSVTGNEKRAENMAEAVYAAFQSSAVRTRIKRISLHWEAVANRLKPRLDIEFFDSE